VEVAIYRRMNHAGAFGLEFGKRRLSVPHRDIGVPRLAAAAIRTDAGLVIDLLNITVSPFAPVCRSTGGSPQMRSNLKPAVALRSRRCVDVANEKQRCDSNQSLLDRASATTEASIDLHPGGLGNLCPFLDLFADEGAEFRCRHGQRRDALLRPRLRD